MFYRKHYRRLVCYLVASGLSVEKIQEIAYQIDRDNDNFNVVKFMNAVHYERKAVGQRT